MSRFTGMQPVFRREFKAYFSSPLGYVFIVIFLVASGFLTLSRDFGRLLELRQAVVQTSPGIIAADRNACAANDGTGIQAFIHLHDTHAGFTVT